MILPLPSQLEDLLAAGRWPRTAEEERQQHLQPLVSPERIRQLAPEETFLYLYAPRFTPFESVVRRMTIGIGRNQLPMRLTLIWQWILETLGLGLIPPSS